MALVAGADVGGGGKSYNKQDETRIALQKLNDKYKELIACFKKTDGDVIDKLEEGWKGPDLIKFVNEVLSEAMKTAVDSATKALESVNKALNGGAENYAKNFDHFWTKILFAPTLYNTKKLAEFTGDTLGVVNDAAIKLAEDNLRLIGSQAEDFLNDCKRICQKSGFYGGSQQSEIDGSMTKIGSNINKMVGEIEKGTGVKAEGAISKAQRIANRNAQNFTAEEK